jgi:type III restriction enzyme
MQNYEVPEPIINSPFDEPAKHWFIREGEPPELRPERRPAIVYPPREERKERKVEWSLADGTLRHSTEYAPAFELSLVNLIRERLSAWRRAGWPSVTRTTHELLAHWRRDGREKRLFFAQLEAAETIIFLTEARADFRQGIAVPRDEPSDDKKAEGFTGFVRYACKMATGSGKTTVMAMLAAWSILNKVNDRSDGRFSDVVLAVCPNVTIRSRLGELDPENGEASIYRTRDLVPAQLMPHLSQGKVLITNWHVFEPQTPQSGGDSARVVRAGVAVQRPETITIAAKSTTARGGRYLTLDAYQAQVAAGRLRVIEEERDADGSLKKVRVESIRYVESDTALVTRVLGREVGGKQNILVLNDEAHHAYPHSPRRAGRGRRRGLGRFLPGGDRLDRRLGPCTQAARHQLLRGPVGDSVLSRPRRAADQPAVSVGSQRLRAGGRDRVGAGEDSATGGARHDRGADTRVLQYLALDPAPTHVRRARRQARQSEA